MGLKAVAFALHLGDYMFPASESHREYTWTYKTSFHKNLCDLKQTPIGHRSQKLSISAACALTVSLPHLLYWILIFSPSFFHLEVLNFTVFLLPLEWNCQNAG